MFFVLYFGVEFVDDWEFLGWDCEICVFFVFYWVVEEEFVDVVEYLVKW